MSNVFPLVDAGALSTIYDLKGSTVGRSVHGDGATPALCDHTALDVSQDGTARSLQACAPSTPTARAVDDSNGHAEPGGDDGVAAHHSAHLKGVGVNRQILKDISFRKHYPFGLPIPGSHRHALVNQLLQDVTLLASMGLMDYSLMVCVVPVDTLSHSEESRYLAEAPLPLTLNLEGGLPCNHAKTILSRSEFCYKNEFGECASHAVKIWSPLSVTRCVIATDRRVVAGAVEAMRSNIDDLSQLPQSSSFRHGLVQIGIIDLLQPYNTQKRFEHGLKSIRHANLHVDISAVDPNTYAVRFADLFNHMFPA